MRTGLLIVAASLLGFGASGYAQERPCMADAARLCAGVEPGGGAQMQCLKAHQKELSPACKKKVLQTKLKQEEQKQMQQQQMPQQQMPQQP